MDNKLSDILRRVAESTFESLAFLLPAFDESSDGARPPLAAGPAVTIRFSGPQTGRLMLRVSQGFLVPLAANMLGLECDQEPPAPPQQLDALKELLNVVCGNLLPELSGARAVFNLCPPQVRDDGGAESPDAPCTKVQLALDEGQAELTLWLHEPAGRQPAAQIQGTRSV